jgi:hypothetical protein
MKILKSLISGIGALPVDFKGRINNKSFIVKVQFKIDGSAAAQIWSDQKVILEVEGRAGEQAGLAQKFLNFATPDKEDQDVYKKTAKDFINQLHKEVKDYNRKKGVKKKAVESSKPVKLYSSKYYLWLGGYENGAWFLKSGQRRVPVDGVPFGRLVYVKDQNGITAVYDVVTGFYVAPFSGTDETPEILSRAFKNQGLKSPEEVDDFLKKHGEKWVELIKKNGTWFPKPSLTESKKTTVRKKATTTRKATTTKKAPAKKEKEIYYIEFLNKAKGFQPDRKEFKTNAAAVKWGKANLPNFNMDMVRLRFEPVSSGSKTTTVRKKATTRKATTAKKATTKKATTRKATTRKATTRKATTTSSRQTGSSNELYDARKSALPPGKRRSASGTTYYEYRKNHSDKPGSKI